MMKFLILLALALPAVMGRQISQFVVGGSTGNIANHPHQLSMRYSSSHSCGASLISTTRAVCAAHCGGSAVSYYSILGGTTDRTITSCSTCVLRNLISFIRHPNYNENASGYPYDISVLTFSAVTTNSNLRAISMATSASGDFSGVSCVITGWGKTSSTSSLPINLQQGSMTVMTNSACAGTWGSSINSGHICVTAPTVSACNGDSGGPLVCSGVLAGATSWGVSDCSPSYPSVYSRISTFYSWIIAQ
jgi:secreted trypsin-like serine protease